MVKNYELRPYPIRVPVDLKEKIESAAKENNRSYHAELITRLENSFKEATTKSKYDEIMYLYAAFDQLIDNPDLFDTLKKRREIIQKIQPLQKFIIDHSEMIDEETAKDPMADLETIINRVKAKNTNNT